ncbi:MAG: hypothetical protein ACRYGR_06695 [Janthinobacterium lividum]
MMFVHRTRSFLTTATDRLVLAHDTMPLAFHVDAVLLVSLLSKLRVLRDVTLNTRNFVQAMVAVHLLWLAKRLAEPGNAFLADPKQYRFFLEKGGEHAWMLVFMLGGLAGLAGLWGGKRWTRVTGAFAMGTVEKVIAWGLTSSGAAPTAGPTYGILVVLCSWLILAQWMPRPDET